MRAMTLATPPTGRRSGGFTLIELLVVVALIGILTGIAALALKDSPIRAKEAITKIGLEFEAKSETTTPHFQGLLKKQKDWMASEGMVTITFENADREKWLNAAKDAGWGEVIERSPVHGPKLKKLFSK